MYQAKIKYHYALNDKGQVIEGQGENPVCYA